MANVWRYSPGRLSGEGFIPGYGAGSFVVREFFGKNMRPGCGRMDRTPGCKPVSGPSVVPVLGETITGYAPAASRLAGGRIAR